MTDEVTLTQPFLVEKMNLKERITSKGNVKQTKTKQKLFISELKYQSKVLIFMYV